MAEIVPVVLEKLKSVALQEIEDEMKLVIGVKREVEKLASNFEAIQDGLVQAEKRQLQEDTVKRWLDKLKAVAYDIEDVLDGWNTSVTIKSQHAAEVRRPSISVKRKILAFFRSSRFLLSEVGVRRETALKIKELNERLEDIAREKTYYIFRSDEVSAQRPISVSLVDASKVKGRGVEKRRTINMLLRGEIGQRPDLQVISIVGMGGIGKTTLAQIAYNDDRVKKHFDERIWVCVSDPFDEIRVAKSILESLSGSSPNLAELDNILLHISRLISKKKFLLVLDDVWEDRDPSKWERLKHALISGLPGSKVMMTTRNKRVADIMCSPVAIELPQLSEKDSWELFSELAFSERTSGGDDLDRFKDVGRKIVDRCKGLPLAVKTLGSLLRSKESKIEWQSVLYRAMWEVKEVKEGLFEPSLLKCYDELPSEMRQCFLYCAVFAKDYQLRKDDLISLWMAQGYLRPSGNKEMEEIGEDYLSFLCKQSLLHCADIYPTDQLLLIRGIEHDFAQFMTKSENFSVDADGFEEAMPSVGDEARHLMMMLGRDHTLPRNNFTRVNKLRSLLLEIESPQISGLELSSILGQLTLLRALKLRNSSIVAVPDEVGNLIHLRYLDLSMNRALKALPESIGQLVNLQTLDVDFCSSLEKLPSEIGKLINLRHLRNSGTVSLKFMPKGVGSLINLRTLGEFVLIGEDGLRDNEGLKNMNKLRGRMTIRGLGKVRAEGEVKKAQLKSKKHLTTLVLVFDYVIKEEEAIPADEGVIGALEPPPELRVLEIKDYRSLSLFPGWMLTLSNLTTLQLSNCIKLEELPPLGRLQVLEYLTITNMTAVRRVGEEFLGMETESTEKKDKEILSPAQKNSSSKSIAFPRLKQLEIYEMPNWEDWNIMSPNGHGDHEFSKRSNMIMPGLKVLALSVCPRLKALPEALLLNQELQLFKNLARAAKT